jgi:transcription antitermination protein NusB
MGRRRQARILALQALYMADTGAMSGEEAMGIVSADSDLDESNAAFAWDLAVGTVAEREELDRRIQTLAQNWEVGRMAVVDRNLLRMASFELLRRPDVPSAIVIDEALEIAKAYSSLESAAFLNGILDKIRVHDGGIR